jgi:cell division protein FtsA
MVYAGEVLVAAGCIAVGGDHVTNDIEVAFPRLGQAEAEKLKRTEGCAMIVEDGRNPRIEVQLGLRGLDTLHINRRALYTVINARVDELFRILRTKLVEEKVLPALGAGMVLTGGGAYLRGIEDVARYVLGMPCVIGMPQNVDWVTDVEQPASFATIAGLVMYGHQHYKDAGLFTSLSNFWKGAFRS